MFGGVARFVHSEKKLTALTGLTVVLSGAFFIAVWKGAPPATAFSTFCTTLGAMFATFCGAHAVQKTVGEKPTPKANDE